MMILLYIIEVDTYIKNFGTCCTCTLLWLVEFFTRTYVYVWFFDQKKHVVDTLNSETKSLDDDQLFVVNSAINYAKNFKKSLNGNMKLPEPILMKVVGSAGTGKSHVIHLVTQWTEHILRSAGDDLDCPNVIKTAFTGAASCNIGNSVNYH